MVIAKIGTSDMYNILYSLQHLAISNYHFKRFLIYATTLKFYELGVGKFIVYLLLSI